MKTETRNQILVVFMRVLFPDPQPIVEEKPRGRIESRSGLKSL
jgi:hypothetical protein